MRVYPGQPTEEEVAYPAGKVAKLIGDKLKELLPECDTNDWFVDQPDFANMCDIIADDIEGLL